MESRLFVDLGDLASHLLRLKDLAAKKLEAVSEEALMESDPSSLAKEISDQVVPQAPSILAGEYKIDRDPARHAIAYKVQTTGDFPLLDYTPSTYAPPFPSGRVVGATVWILVPADGKTADKVQSSFEAELNRSLEWCERLREDLAHFEAQLVADLTADIKDRQARIRNELEILKELQHRRSL